MKILIIGANGQLGRSLRQSGPVQINGEYIQIINLKKTEFDLLDPTRCKRCIMELKPDWVINSAAYTAVDESEDKPDLAMAINCYGPRAVAEALLETGGKLLQISTDFVFDGKKNIAYLPEDNTNPICAYGKSKSEAEKVLKKILEPTGQIKIIRTSWLIGPVGNNFASTMLRLHKEKEMINVVCDQIGCCTSTINLALICWKLIEKSEVVTNIPTILHWSDAGVTSWYDIAVAIGEIAEELLILKKAATINPITSSEYPTKAIRPTFSLLNYSSTSKLFGIISRPWRESLKEIISLMAIKKFNYD